MHDFNYRNNRLYCEGVAVSRIARSVGTPFYLYSHKTICDHYRKLERAFEAINPLICYSVKANSNQAILKGLVNMGAGLDIVSGGELYRAIRAGVDPEKIVYAGIGKTAAEIDAAMRKGILFFNVESLSELEAINRRAKALNKHPNVALRVNPDVLAKTHRHITTGTKQNKFGLDFNTAKWIFVNSGKFSNVRLRGIHLHIGSQIVESGPFIKAIKLVMDFIFSLRNTGIKIEYFNIGGGLGIIYKDERPQNAEDYARAILPILENMGLKIILEPGRFIVGNAGILVTRTTYVKKTKAKNFIIVDAGMNDLVRPTLYEAYHEVAPVNSSRTRTRASRLGKFDIVGPICESGDFFALDRKMGEPTEGDLLAIMSAGAYGFTMSSNYNSRVRPCEVMVIGKKFYVIRERQVYADLIKNESVPSVLK